MYLRFVGFDCRFAMQSPYASWSPVTGTYRSIQIRTENGFSESGLEFSIITYHIHRSRMNTLTERGRVWEGGHYAIFMETRFSQLLLFDGDLFADEWDWIIRTGCDHRRSVAVPYDRQPFPPARSLFALGFYFQFLVSFLWHSALTHICLRASVWIKLNGIESRKIVNSAQNHHTRRIMWWEQPKSWYNLKTGKSKWRQCKDRSLKQQHQRLELGQMRKEEHRKQKNNRIRSEPKW